MDTPTVYTLGQASKATGKSKATISKALKSGKISYLEKTSAGYKIDASEVHRVYPKLDETVSSERLDTPVNTPETNVLQAELNAEKNMRSRLEGEIDDLKAQRDEWMNQAKHLALPKPTNDDTMAVGQGAQYKLGWWDKVLGRKEIAS